MNKVNYEIVYKLYSSYSFDKFCSKVSSGLSVSVLFADLSLAWEITSNFKIFSNQKQSTDHPQHKNTGSHPKKVVIKHFPHHNFQNVYVNFLTRFIVFRLNLPHTSHGSSGPGPEPEAEASVDEVEDNNVHASALLQAEESGRSHAGTVKSC